MSRISISVDESKALMELSKILTEMLRITPEQLTRLDLGSDLNFARGIYYFDNTLRLFRELSEADTEDLPLNKIKVLISTADQALGHFKQILSFAIKDYPQNPLQSRDNILQELIDSYEEYFSIVSPIIAYQFSKVIDLSRVDKMVETLLTKVHTDLAEQEDKSKLLLVEAQGTLDKLKQAAQEVGVVQHSIHFKLEADEHQGAANKWLWVTSILGVVAVGLAIGSIFIYFRDLPNWTAAQSIQLALAKIIVFSVLFYGLVGSTRVYRAHRHNYVINKHRQNALSTFEAFAKAAEDLETKSAVLLQTTQCIFSSQHSGYVSEESEGGFSSVLEIVRGIAAPHSK